MVLNALSQPSSSNVGRVKCAQITQAGTVSETLDITSYRPESVRILAVSIELSCDFIIVRSSDLATSWATDNTSRPHPRHRHRLRVQNMASRESKSWVRRGYSKTTSFSTFPCHPRIPKVCLKKGQV